ncbi:hypothetical protein AGMMS49525_18530 [Bacteroidia bacterium]|nr:hypothetical protein AGMMS49525_18530 [Bacteroidia bacterium]
MKRHVWKSDELVRLKEIYPDMTNAEIASVFGVSESAIENRAFKLGLKKSNAYMAIHSSCYPKGNIPQNKGKKITEWMSPDGIARCSATQFKVGQLGWNHKPVGYERVQRDGYIYVKVAEPNKFRLKHRMVWERHNGAIPAGHNIQFKDGNRENCDISNLYMISRDNQLKHENSLTARYPKEMQQLIQLKGALNRQINKINKNGNN